MEALAQTADLDVYRAAFERIEAERGNEPAWLRALRREGLTRFLETGFPTTKIEAWKYTSLRPIAENVWNPARREAMTSAPPAGLDSVRIAGAAEAVFVNGWFRPDLSRLGGQGQAQGVRATSLREALSRRPDELRGTISKICSVQRSWMAALNTAFFEDGILLETAAGAVAPSPLHVIFLSVDDDPAAVSFPRVLVMAGRESQATIIETYFGPRGSAGAGWSNAVTEISLADGAVVEHYKLQLESTGGFHTHAMAVTQGRASSFTSHHVALGGSLARTDIDVLLGAEGSDCSLNGLFMGSGSQHLDTHTMIDHAVPHGTSRELYKGILDGRSRGVFHGTILVRAGAQKTDAIQTNRNLLLSREALVDSTPALEILADDVKCRHGSTIGQLDANSLFYLRSRGIGEAEARALLTYAFAADIAERMKCGPVRERIETFLGQTLSEGRGILRLEQR